MFYVAAYYCGFEEGEEEGVEHIIGPFSTYEAASKYAAEHDQVPWDCYVQAAVSPETPIEW